MASTSTLEPQPQMAEGARGRDDGKTWTFKLRPGLTFHDGEKVLPKDVVASLKRWMVRDSDGPDHRRATGGDGRRRTTARSASG